jgi:Mce-associated membrane protein
VVAESPADPVPETASARGASRLGRSWLIGICAALLLLSAAVAAGGYLALRAYSNSAADARAEAQAVKAAEECVGAMQAPDSAAMAQAQRKIIECSTGDFGVQATMYSGILVDAYQAAKVQVQVSDMRAAVERHNDDGSIQVLVAMRVKVTNSETANQEQGYRLRAQLARADGTYKISKLEQVSS